MSLRKVVHYHLSDNSTINRGWWMYKYKLLVLRFIKRVVKILSVLHCLIGLIQAYSSKIFIMIYSTTCWMGGDIIELK